MKKILLIAFLLMFLPVTAHAHSGLSSSTPAEGETLEGSPAEIQFLFESPIQQGDMTVTDESGNTVAVSDISFSEMELSGQLDEELPNGTYTVDWSVISQDSHEITGTLTFDVAAEEVEEPAAEETNEEATEEQTSEDSTETSEETEEAASPADEQAEEATASADEPAQQSSSWVTIIIIAILAIAAITFFVMARRK